MQGFPKHHAYTAMCRQGFVYRDNYPCKVIPVSIAVQFLPLPQLGRFLLPLLERALSLLNVKKTVCGNGASASGGALPVRGVLWRLCRRLSSTTVRGWRRTCLKILDLLFYMVNGKNQMAKFGAGSINEERWVCL